MYTTLLSWYLKYSIALNWRFWIVNTIVYKCKYEVYTVLYVVFWWLSYIYNYSYYYYYNTFIQGTGPILPFLESFFLPFPQVLYNPYGVSTPLMNVIAKIHMWHFSSFFFFCCLALVYIKFHHPSVAPFAQLISLFLC